MIHQATTEDFNRLEKPNVPYSDLLNACNSEKIILFCSYELIKSNYQLKPRPMSLYTSDNMHTFSKMNCHALRWRVLDDTTACAGSIDERTACAVQLTRGQRV
jgi:hypothetical protein